VRPELDPTPPRLIRILACWLVLDGLLLAALWLCHSEYSIRMFFFACLLGSTLAQIQLLGGYYMLIQEHCRYALLLWPAVIGNVSLGVILVEYYFYPKWTIGMVLGLLVIFFIGNMLIHVGSCLPYAILTCQGYILGRCHSNDEDPRTRLQFSIRFLLQLTLLAAVACAGWKVLHENPVSKHRLAELYFWCCFFIVPLLSLIAFHRERFDWLLMLVVLLHVFMIAVTFTVSEEEFKLFDATVQIAHALILLGTCWETRRQGYRLIRNASKWDYRREWDAPPSIFAPKDSTNSQQL
jgi:hypothetical protein